jgi:hypothetical protein
MHRARQSLLVIHEFATEPDLERKLRALQLVLAPTPPDEALTPDQPATADPACPPLPAAESGERRSA